MGRKLVLTGVTLTDLSAPKLATIDPIEAPGSLLLIDPTHPINPWVAGVPTSGYVTPNLFAENAAALGISDSASPLVLTANTPSNLKVERTAKGGLHGILTAANIPIANEGVNLGISAAMTEFLRTTTHHIYLSMWMRVTRSRISTSGLMQAPFLQVSSNSADSSNSRFRLAEKQGSRPTPGNSANLGYHYEDLYQSAALTTQLGNKRLSVATSGWSGTVPGSAGSMQRALFRVGRPSGATSAPNDVGSPSYAFYRVYIEDLTVSGRTYAEADAIDAQLYEDTFSLGGRYYGDTYTDPASLP